MSRRKNVSHRRPDFNTAELKNITVTLCREDWELFQALMRGRRVTASYALRLYIKAALRKARRDGEMVDA